MKNLFEDYQFEKITFIYIYFYDDIRIVKIRDNYYKDEDNTPGIYKWVEQTPDQVIQYLFQADKWQKYQLQGGNYAKYDPFEESLQSLL